jgi:poly-beta-1,6-N-acetyl-D-glucosamine synthase
MALKIILFISLLVVLYSYIGYGLIVFLCNRLKVFSKGKADLSAMPDFEPHVTLIIAAYNEQDFIRQKIENSLALGYPSEKLIITFVADGSIDNTVSIIKEYPGINLLFNNERKGKVAAMHRAMQTVMTPYVIFSDANTLLNKESIRNIIRHYADPEVGGVAGEKKVVTSFDTLEKDSGEGMYWKYESFLKKEDYEFYSVVGAAGELFSLQTKLYEHPGNNVLLDDFVISLRVCLKGYRVAYEPDAYALETPSLSLSEERKRKIRISAGGFQSMVMLKHLLHFTKHKRLTFQYVSHRVLRWTLCPLMIPLIFISNLLIVLIDPSLFYILLLYAQIAFYFCVLLGWALPFIGIKPGKFYVFYYFIFMNISLYQGFFRYLGGKQSVIWDKALRTKPQ